MTRGRLACSMFLLTLAGLPSLTAQSVATEEAPHAFDMAVPGYHYRFPDDHGAHERFRTEWWYYTGHLTAADGRRFGFELTFFDGAFLLIRFTRCHPGGPFSNSICPISP